MADIDLSAKKEGLFYSDRKPSFLERFLEPLVRRVKRVFTDPAAEAPSKGPSVSRREIIAATTGAAAGVVAGQIPHLQVRSREDEALLIENRVQRLLADHKSIDKALRAVVDEAVTNKAAIDDRLWKIADNLVQRHLEQGLPIGHNNSDSAIWYWMSGYRQILQPFYGAVAIRHMSDVFAKSFRESRHRGAGEYALLEAVNAASLAPPFDSVHFGFACKLADEFAASKITAWGSLVDCGLSKLRQQHAQAPTFSPNIGLMSQIVDFARNACLAGENGATQHWAETISELSDAMPQDVRLAERAIQAWEEFLTNPGSGHIQGEPVRYDNESALLRARLGQASIYLAHWKQNPSYLNRAIGALREIMDSTDTSIVRPYIAVLATIASVPTRLDASALQQALKTLQDHGNKSSRPTSLDGLEMAIKEFASQAQGGQLLRPWESYNSSNAMDILPEIPLLASATISFGR